MQVCFLATVGISHALAELLVWRCLMG